MKKTNNMSEMSNLKAYLKKLGTSKVGFANVDGLASEFTSLPNGISLVLKLPKQAMHFLNEEDYKSYWKCFHQQIAELTEIVLKKWGIYDFFFCFFFSEDLNTNKMFADVYLAAADNMGVSYEKCAVFEDISLPLNAVKKYKMGYFGVYDENRSDEVKKELELKSDFYIKDYDEFIEKGYVEKFFHLKGE